MKISLYSPEEGFETLGGWWDELVRASVYPSVFVTRSFQRIWWNHFGTDRTMKILAVRDNSGSPACIFTMVSKDDPGCSIPVLELPGDTDVWDHRDIVVRRGTEEKACRALLEYLEGEDWKSLDFRSIPEGSTVMSAFVGQAADVGYEVDVAGESSCPLLVLPRTFDDYLWLLGKKERHEVRRKLRRAASLGDVALTVFRDGEGLRRGMETFLSLHRSSYRAKDLFMSADMGDFFMDLAFAAARDGFLHLFLLELDGRPVAALLCFSHLDTIYAYNSGYDPDYTGISPGIVLFAHAIRYSIEEGFGRFDFLRGGEPYKQRLGGVPYDLYRVTIRRTNAGKSS